MSLNSFDIEYKGSLILENSVIAGNVKSDKDIYLKGMVMGNVHCTANLIINRDAVIDGDVYCENLYTDGSIIGNVHVNHRSQMAANAVIKGYLITSCLSLHSEAIIEKGLKLKDKLKK